MNLGEPLDTDLAAFCAAYYHTPAINVVREAVEEHIRKVLASEPERRKKFEEAKKRLLNEDSRKLAVVPLDDG